MDVLGNEAVAMASSAWVLQHTECITQAVKEAIGVEQVTWRADEAMMQLEGLYKEDIARLCSVRGSGSREAMVKEGGINYLVNPVRSTSNCLVAF